MFHKKMIIILAYNVKVQNNKEKHLNRKQKVLR